MARARARDRGLLRGPCPHNPGTRPILDAPANLTGRSACTTCSCNGGGVPHKYAITDFVSDRSEQCQPPPKYTFYGYVNPCAGSGDGIHYYTFSNNTTTLSTGN